MNRGGENSDSRTQNDGERVMNWTFSEIMTILSYDACDKGVSYIEELQHR